VYLYPLAIQFWKSNINRRSIVLPFFSLSETTPWKTLHINDANSSIERKWREIRKVQTKEICSDLCSLMSEVTPWTSRYGVGVSLNPLLFISKLQSTVQKPPQSRFRRERKSTRTQSNIRGKTSSMLVKNHGTDTVHFHIFNYLAIITGTLVLWCFLYIGYHT